MELWYAGLFFNPEMLLPNSLIWRLSRVSRGVSNHLGCTDLFWVMVE